MTNRTRFDYSGAKVLMTGGTSGIGHALATAFADAGATVTVTGTRPGPGEYGTELGAFDYQRGEMTDPATIDGVLGSLDAPRRARQQRRCQFPRRQRRVGPRRVRRRAHHQPRRADAPHRRLPAPAGREPSGRRGQRDQHRVDVGVPVDPDRPGYGSAKAGLVALTGNLARHWVDDGIRVNAVAPGVIDTPMTAPMAHLPELLAAELAHTPMGRLGTPADVVGAVLFLASSAAALHHRTHPRRRRRVPAPVTARPLAPHYHVGIVVADLPGAQAELMTSSG